jgi:hypothetical protein
VTTEKGPKRRRVAFPVMTRFPRVGKIRLGEQVPTKSGSSLRPSKLDYFRVEAEESGVTSAEAAESFHEVYGDKPTSLRCVIPGPTPESVFEGAWRLYGANKLKRICDGQTCDERTATGGWVESPCICAARAYAPDHRDRCKLTWSLQVLLPDVKGIGVWQIDTGSEISVRRVSAWLRMMYELTKGDLSLLEFWLDLVETKVAPEGKATSVYVLQPRATDLTPRQMLEGGGRAERVLLEAGSLPETPAPLVEDMEWEERQAQRGEGIPHDEDTGEVLEPEVVEEPEVGTMTEASLRSERPPASEVNVLKERIEVMRKYGLSDQQIKAAGKAGGIDNWGDIVDDVVWEQVRAEAWKLAEAQRETTDTDFVPF